MTSAAMSLHCLDERLRQASIADGDDEDEGDNDAAVSSSAETLLRQALIGGEGSSSACDSRDLPQGSVFGEGSSSSTEEEEEEEGGVENRRENDRENTLTTDKDFACDGTDDFETFKRDLAAIVDALSCSSSPTRPGSRAAAMTAQRGARRSGPRIGNQQQPQRHSSLVLAVSLQGQEGGSSRRRRAEERRRIRPTRQCVGPCCTLPRRQQLSVRSPREQQPDGSSSPSVTSLSSVNESATSWKGFPPSQKRCYVVNDPTFNASTLLSSAE